MPVKKYNPITPGLRRRVSVDYSVITTDKPEKSLTVGKHSTGGRNNDGRRTQRNRGGGHKRKYRIIDFTRRKDGLAAVVKTIEYDPNRTAFICLVEYTDGEKAYMIAPQGVKVGDTIESGKSIAPEVGNTMPLSDIPIGTTIFNIEMQPGRGGVLVRSAGTSAILVGREGKLAIVKLPSGEIRKIMSECRATIGTVSNPDHGLVILGKAGRNRWNGRRPRVRGVAMNPVDHPMGGGEGRASGGHPRSRNNQMAKGQKTRNPKKASNKFIISRKKSSK
jgi:large subunit ribosomal protein L2